MTDQPRAAGFSTLAIHAGIQRHAERPHVTAIDQLADVTTEGGDHAAALGAPPLPPADPVNTMLEERVAALEGGSAALALASGQAARFLALQALLRPGDEFIAARRGPDGSASDSYGDLDARFGHTVAGFGWSVKWVDPARPDTLPDALSEKTRAIVCASIADHEGTVTDLGAIATLARRARLPLIVDNTLATPYLVRPFEHGADVVLHATTAFLGGQGPSSGGLIVDGGSFDWLGDDRYPGLSRPSPGHGGVVIGETYGNFAFVTACRVLGLRDLGPALSPFDASLVLNGIETLPLRMRRHCENALAVVRALQRHRAVEWVRYAGLPDDPDHALAERYCPSGAGAILGFGLKGGSEAGAVFLRRLRLFTLASSAGGTRSLVLRPATLAQGARGLSGGGLVRLSVGLEDVEDIIADLDQALRD